MAGDLEVLIDMGFEKERAEMAVKKTGGCVFLSVLYEYHGILISVTVQGALEWLELNQDKTWDEINAANTSAETDPTVEPDALKPGEVAKSLICNDCGKKFRSQAQAEFHAEKTYVPPMWRMEG
jgi:hypothetical protein